HGHSVGMIMLDIDRFGSFNKEFGYDCGDAVLEAVGALLLRKIRAEDLACRLGGEEFLVILPDASLKVTHRRAEKIREDFKQLRPLCDEMVLGPITCSVGVAVYPMHGNTHQRVLGAADKAMRQAKALGRDRVILASPPQPGSEG